MMNESDQRVFHSFTRYATTLIMFCMNSYRPYQHSTASQNYEQRKRALNREISCRASSLTHSNFIIQMMLTDCY